MLINIELACIGQEGLMRNKGFTLFEILVVMAIIGIAAAAIVIGVGSYYVYKREPENVTREMASLVDIARNQAIFSLATLGLRITTTTYQFLELQPNNTWQNLRDTFWKPRKIPNGISVRVQSSFNAGDAPQIIIYPNGEITPFIIQLNSEVTDKRFTIKGTAGGVITVDAL